MGNVPPPFWPGHSCDGKGNGVRRALTANMKLGMRRGPAGPAEASRDRPPRRLEASPDAILVELVQSLSGSGGFRELLALVARGVLEAVAADFVAVGVCRDATLHGVALEVGTGYVSEPSGFELPLYPKLANWMQAAECTVISGFDPAQASGLPPIFWRFQALAVFPMRFQSCTHGLILAGFEEPRTLSEEEIKQTKTVAGITAMAIGQARAERAQSSQEQTVGLLEKIEVDWSEGTPIEELFERLAAAAQSLVGAASACIAEVQGDSLIPRAQAGEAPFADWLSAAPQPETAPWRKTLRTGETSIGFSTAKQPAEAWQEWMRLGGLEWLGTLPLQHEGETAGVFLVAFATKPAEAGWVLAILHRLASRSSMFLGAERVGKRVVAVEASFRNLFERVSEAVLLLDPAGRCQSANPAARQLFGRPEADLRGHAWHDTIPEWDRERVQEWVKRVVSGELAVPINVQLAGASGRDGAGATAELRLVPSLLGERYYLMARDLTGEVNLKNELGRLRCQLGSLLDSLDCGVLLYATDGRILLANQRLAQVLGLDYAKLRGCLYRGQMLEQMRAELFLPDESFERWRRLDLESEEVAWDQLEIARPTRRSVERYGRPVYDEVGGLLGRLEVHRDISGQALTEEKMQRADRMASLGLLISGIAHELNNPLTGVIGYSQLLLSRSTDPQLRKTLELIHREAGRAARIIRSLLIFAREAKPERRPLDLNEAIRLTVALRAYKLDVENIAVKLALDPRLPRVIGDHHQLQQVFLNLLLNAEQAILRWRGRGKITISTRKEGDNYVAAVVQDDGPGIAPAIQSKIFDPFFTTKPAGEGTGLGLSIAYGILREHGGQIKVKSEPGCGTEFTVLLPVTEVPAVAGLEGRERAPLKAGHAHMLVVEDEATVAALIVEVLAEEGHEVESVLDGREGLERIKRGTYDLVICDLKMPELDGGALYQELVNIGHPAQHRLLLITGDTLNEHTIAFLEKSKLPHLAKPFLVEELKTMVNSLLGQARAEAGP